MRVVCRRSSPRRLIVLALRWLFCESPICDIRYGDVFLGFSGGLSEANHVGDSLIGNNSRTAVATKHVPIETFSDRRILYSPIFLEKPEDLSFVGPNKFDAR